MGRTKLLILLPSNELFGQEQALIGVAVALRNSNVESHFLIHGSWGGKIAEHVASLGFGYSTLPLGSIWSLSIFRREKGQMWRNILGLLKTPFEFARISRNLSATHFLTGNTSFTAYLLPALYLSNIIVVYRHGDEAAGHTLFHRILNRLIFRRANKHVANCQYLKEQLSAKYKLVNLCVIYNCPVRFRKETAGSAKKLAKFDSQSVRSLYVGQLAEHKGIFLLFDAFRQIADRIPKLSLDIVGAFPGVGVAAVKNVEDPLNKLVADYPSRVVHHGFLDNPIDIFKAADVHVLPSVWQDPSPNVVLEAKSQGVPSIGFDVGGVAELIRHGEDGYICEPVSAKALAAGIEWMFSDTVRLDGMQQSALKNYRTNFGPERFRTHWLNLLGLDNTNMSTFTSSDR